MESHTDTVYSLVRKSYFQTIDFALCIGNIIGIKVNQHGFSADDYLHKVRIISSLLVSLWTLTSSSAPENECLAATLAARVSFGVTTG